MSFFTELKRRNVFRMGIAYTVVAWVLLQAVDFTLDIISAPNWVMQVFFLAAVVGLPVVLIFSWVFEMTPEGIKLESQIKPDESVTQHTSQKLDRTIITFLAIAVVLLLGELFITKEDVPLAIPAPEATVTPPEVTGQSTVNSVRSVAVLPFVNMSSDPEQEYFSDGLSEELLNRLAQNDRLRVAARTSSFQFKGQNLDIGEIGRQLKVKNILEGSVRKSANRLRITAQLIQVDTGFHLWSETYEREMDDVFAIQDDISQAITQALEAELNAGQPSVASNPTENLEAYQLYLQARYLFAKRGGDNLLRSVELFKQATDLDANFSEAWSGMGVAYSLLPVYTFKMSAKEASQLAVESAQKAIQIDPESPEAYMVLGRINARTDLDVESARKNFEKAYQMAPNNADIVNLYGDFLTLTGDFSNALKIEARAVELDPLAAVHHSDMAFLYLILNRNEQALESARTAKSLAPESWDRSDSLIMSLLRLSKYDQAIEAIEEAESKPGAIPEYASIWWAMLYYCKNDRESLRRILVERQESAKINRMMYPTITAFYITWLEGVEAAIPLLQVAYDNRDQVLGWPEYFYLPELVSDDPAWLAFWKQPGLAELIEARREFGPYENIGYWKERTTQ